VAAFGACRQAHLIEPLPLPHMQRLLARATLLLTDSGGLQEEATYLGIPTLVLREVTERPEGVEAGVLRLVGTNGQSVCAALADLLDNERSRLCMARPSDVYGDGRVSARIVDALGAWRI
jgi:UDP-N-acetylglucosamine 2-epimerase (non-hydrolysing)